MAALTERSYYFRMPYKIVLALSAIVLLTSSVSVGSAGLRATHPLPLLFGAVIAAIALASLTVPYLLISGGKMRIYMFFVKREFLIAEIDKMVVAEGGSVAVHLKNGSIENIRLYHVPAKQREELVGVLKTLAPFEDARKGK